MNKVLKNLLEGACITIILIVALAFNYRFFSFDKGLVRTDYITDGIVDELVFAANIDQVYYYSFQYEEADYVVIVSTRSYGNFLYLVKEEDIEIFEVAGLLFNDLAPIRIFPIHWGWFLGGVIFIGLIAQIRENEKKKKKEA